MNRVDVTTFTDLNSLSELKAKAGSDPKAAVGDVAKQFESLLMHQMLKAMREASFGGGILDNDQSLFYRDMFDQQLAIHLAESGGMGLAEVIERQLGGSADVPTGGLEVASYRQSPIPTALMQTDSIPVDNVQSMPMVTGEPAETTVTAPLNVLPETPEEFVQQLLPMAREAAALIGLEPQVLLAQAALESGWGKHVMQQPDGTLANNLFGIKADKRWQGDRVSVSTLEYEDGVAVRKRAQFRAYESFRESFMDYVDFLQSDPRYENALQVTDDPATFFSELQKAGYATDPRYADKITNLLQGKQMQQALQLKAAESQPL